jgi:hypothetical protein
MIAYLSNRLVGELGEVLVAGDARDMLKEKA